METKLKPQAMLIKTRQNKAYVTKRSGDAFSLVEVLVALLIFGMVSAGILWGYVQANRLAEWSSMSLGAQSYALQGIEQARAAKWDTASYRQVMDDFLPVPASTGTTNYTQLDTNDVPQSGAPLLLTNVITISNVYSSTNGGLNLRQIRSDVYWKFPLTGRLYTNTVITFRAPDQ
jgi:prepilin-type N-terminal cleavage/methylation domain-containing protein